MPSHHDVSIIGGGAIGMTSALELANRGHKVCLIEKNHLGQGSSWAGAGLLVCTSKQPSHVAQLMLRSVSLYGHLCPKLKKETGIDPELYESGLLCFERALMAVEASDWPVETFSEAAFERRFPLLTPLKSQAVFYPKLMQVRNPRLVKALHTALLQHPNVTVSEHETVLSFSTQAGRINAIQTNKGKRSAGEIVVTAGAWSSLLLKELGFKGEIFPIRGQLLAFDYGQAVNIPIVYGERHYLVPRQDGIILAGTTMENVGYDEVPTEAAFHELKAAAFEMMPSLEKTPLISQWSGLRPAIHHETPYIGRVQSYENLWINSGHFRNGLVLAPASAELVADLMETKTPSVAWPLTITHPF